MKTRPAGAPRTKPEPILFSGLAPTKRSLVASERRAKLASQQMASKQVDCPTWAHKSGDKMVIQGSPMPPYLHLESKSGFAELRINWQEDRRCWTLNWHLFDRGMTAVSSGNREVTSRELQAAFGLLEAVLPEDSLMNRRSGRDITLRGLFIRQGQWLNMPCPGTGLDGDPNITIFITHEIRREIRRILRHVHPPRRLKTTTRARARH